LDDLKDIDCDETFPSPTYRCYRSIFTVSWILLCVAMALLFFQLIYNFVRIRNINEEDVKYENIPQNVQTEPQAVDTRRAGSDNRIQ